MLQEYDPPPTGPGTGCVLTRLLISFQYILLFSYSLILLFSIIISTYPTAGVAYNKTGNLLGPKGAVGYGVRLLNQFIQDHYEK